MLAIQASLRKVIINEPRPVTEPRARLGQQPGKFGQFGKGRLGAKATNGDQIRHLCLQTHTCPACGYLLCRSVLGRISSLHHTA